MIVRDRSGGAYLQGPCVYMPEVDKCACALLIHVSFPLCCWGLPLSGVYTLSAIGKVEDYRMRGL